MWVRFKYNFAYGQDKKWSYIEIPDDWENYGYAPKDFFEDEKKYNKKYSENDRLGEYLSTEERMHSNYEHSDKYRGFDYEIVDGLPPNDELLKTKNFLEHYQHEVERFQKMVDQTGTIKKEDFNVE